MTGHSEWRFSSGYEESSGTYGEEDSTLIRSLSLGIKYQTPSWTFGLGGSYLQLSGSDNVSASGELLSGNTSSNGQNGNSGSSGQTGENGGNGQGRSASSHRVNWSSKALSNNNPFESEGWGDTLFSVGYLLPVSDPDYPFVELTGKLKLPTASTEAHLGSGEIDYSLQLDLAQPLGTETLFASVGYQVKGDSAENSLDDGPLYSLGIAHPFTLKLSGSLFVDYDTSGNSEIPKQEWFAQLEWKMGGYRLSIYLTQGDSLSTPEQSLGLQFGYRP